MPFVQSNATMPVDLNVTRYRTFPEDGVVELWGYVGDYEVCVHLALDDERVRRLLAEAVPAGGGRNRQKTRQRKSD